jgi:hypothetical protein
MTHLWPNMVRKPQNRDLPDIGGSDSDMELKSTAEDDEDDFMGSTSFPTTFNTSTQPEAASASGHAQKDDFPDLDDLRQQVHLAEMEGMDSMGSVGRLEMFDMMDGDEEDRGFPAGDAEYERLEEWLDGDDAYGDEGEFEVLPVYQGGIPSSSRDTGENGIQVDPSSPTTHAEQEGPDRGFEDDFDDFAAFQTAPRPGSAQAPTLALDPTPLLLHLQSVRVELAGVEDEDERRARAGREVARVMRDLGMGDALGLDDDDDLDFEELRGL